MIEPSAIVEVGVVTPSGDFLGRMNGAALRGALDTGAAANLALGARFLGFVSAYVVGERAWFACGEGNRCGASSEAFGGAVRAELPFDGVRPFIELGLVQRSLFAPAFSRSGSSSSSLTWKERTTSMQFVRTEFRGVDTRFAIGVGFPLGRGAHLDLVARASFGRFTWHSRDPNAIGDPNVPPPSGDIEVSSRTLHGFYSLGVAIRFGGISDKRP